MKRRQATPIAALAPGLRGWLLFGPGEARRQYAAGADLLEGYLLSDDQWRDLWLQHRRELLAEGARLGVSPWGLQFDAGEHDV